MKKRKVILCVMLALSMAVLPTSVAFANEESIETETIVNAEEGAETESESETFTPEGVEGLRLESTGKKSVTICWDPVEEVEGKEIEYVIYRMVGENSEYALLDICTGTSYTDVEAYGREKNYYKVCASYINDDSERIYGPESGVVGARAMLQATENVSAAPAGKNKVSITWDAVEDAEAYLIYAHKNGEYGYCGMTSGKTSFTDTKALDLDYNFYWVFPCYYEEDGLSAGIPAPYVYAKGVLSAVSGLKACVSGEGIKLTWNKLKDADGYIIYRQKGSEGKFEYVYMKDADSPSYYDTGCAMEGYNYYRVYPYHMNGEEMAVGVSDTYVYAQVNPPHEHVWEPITELQDQGTDDPVYEIVGWKYVCNGCKAEFATNDEAWDHVNENIKNHNMSCTGFSEAPIYDITGYEHHENWVEVVVGYRCSICGAEKPAE